MENFKDIINGSKPVLVDFFATWCGPCKMMHPVIEDLSKEIDGTGRILKIDIDKNESLSNKYRIQSVPTFMIFKNGEIVWRSSGVTEKNVLKEEMMKYA